jgi:hypothetical protein
MGRAIANHCFSDRAAGFDPADGNSCADRNWCPRYLAQSARKCGAPNDKKITLCTKSKALVIGMDHYDTWPGRELFYGIP